MIDLHTHSIFSDGELVPSELVRRAAVRGVRVIAITDHVDSSNVDFVVPRLVRVARDFKASGGIIVIPGAEVTHVPPALFAQVVLKARELGAKIVLAHGETLVEPVEEGTNRAAIEARVDILAHPGLISEEDILRAIELDVTLEITARKGHCLANGYVAKEALRLGAAMTINTDSHAPSDLISRDMAVKILLAAGIPHGELDRVFQRAEMLVARVLNTTRRLDKTQINGT
jgi:histidinol phosphatase-like PHP family hydrolase